MNLRFLCSMDEFQFRKAVRSWDRKDFDFIEAWDEELSWKEFLSYLHNREIGFDLAEGRVSDSYFFAFVNNQIVGRISFRHKLNEFLYNIGGQVGYAVLPEHRNKGYAKLMLKQLLEILKKTDLDKILLTCDEDNIASIKVIEENNGIFENDFKDNRIKKNKKRYWISI